MSKYLILIPLILSACSKAAPEPQLFYCLNTSFVIQTLTVKTDDPKVKQDAHNFFLEVNEGTIAVVPKALCIEVKEKK